MRILVSRACEGWQTAGEVEPYEVGTGRYVRGVDKWQE